jgi:hypothetical protein
MRQLIKIGFWNVEGLNVNKDSKLSDPDFLHVIKQHDIIALAETHIGENDSINVEGYKSVKLCRPLTSKINRYFGGIAILYRQQLRPGLKFLEHRNNDYIWMQMCREYFGLDEDVFVCVAYIPPDNSSYCKARNDDTLQYIENDVAKYSSMGKVILTGDFNARTNTELDFISNDSSNDMGDDYMVDLNIIPRNSQDNAQSCSRGKKLLDLCVSARLRIVNGRCVGDAQGQYTCHKYSGSSVVDYLVTSEQNLKRILFLRVLNFLGQLSDHCCLSWAMKCNILNYSNLKMKATKKSYMPDMFIWNKMSIASFQLALSSCETQREVDNFMKSDISDVDKPVDSVTNMLLKAANNSLKVHLKSKSNKNVKRKPWFDRELKDLKQDVLYCSRHMQKHPNLPAVRKMFFTSLKLYKKAKKSKKQKFKEKTLKRLDELRIQEPQAYWRLLNTLRAQKSDCTKNISLEEWEMYFKKLNTARSSNRNEEEIKNQLSELEKTNIFNQLDYTIKMVEVQQSIKNLKKNKSVGLDRVSNEMLCYSQHIMVPVLTKLFNIILRSGQYPSQWCKGYVVPIFKNGDPLLPTNYRGVTILNSMAKLFNSVLNNRLNTFIDQHQLVDEKQIGFRKGSRTSDHLFVLKTLIDKYTEKDGKLYTCFVDFRKAFDSVNHIYLLYKLKQAGVSNMFYDIIKDMYINKGSNLTVKIGNELSSFFLSSIGVHQGDTLSPTLFNLFVNDLTKCLNNSCNPPS